jgi:hypothetical protein
MQIDEKIQCLVWALDSDRLGVKKKIPKNLVDFPLELEALEKYMPPFTERCRIGAWQLCYMAYVQQNPSGTIQDFRNRYVGTIPGHRTYQKALEETASRIPEKVTVEMLERYRQENLDLNADPV